MRTAGREHTHTHTPPTIPGTLSIKVWNSTVHCSQPSLHIFLLPATVKKSYHDAYSICLIFSCFTWNASRAPFITREPLLVREIELTGRIFVTIEQGPMDVPQIAVFILLGGKN